MMAFRNLPRTVLCIIALLCSTWATGQDGAPIKILVGFAPGGLTDIVARLFADKLRVELNQPVVVENKAGAAGRLATQALKASPADGRTLMVVPNSGPIFLEILYPRQALGYDLLKDLVPVGTLSTYPFALVVQRSLGVKNVAEFIAWAKANPQLASYGNAGAGGHAHFIGTRLSQASGVDFKGIPYRGNGPVITDLIGGQIPAAILPAADFAQLRSNPKLQILGLFEEQRSPLVPDVPTMAEQGLPVQVGQAWMGMWAPAQAPRAEVERIAQALRKILSTPEMRESLQSRFTMYPMITSPADMDKLQRAEIELWRPIIKASGFTPEQ
jgi:tripartite-type tricarboxylate transporter receptor subunit TctC